MWSAGYMLSVRLGERTCGSRWNMSVFPIPTEFRDVQFQIRYIWIHRSHLPEKKKNVRSKELKNNLFFLYEHQTLCTWKVPSNEDVVSWLRCWFKHKTNHMMPRGRNWSENDLSVFTNIWSLEWAECRYIFPEKTPENLLTETDDL